MIYTILYILASVISGIIIHIIGNEIPIGLFIFLSTINTMFFFHLINIRSLKKAYKQVFSFKPLLVIGTMLSIALSTISGVLVPIYYYPSEFLFSYIAGLALLSGISSYIKNKNKIDRTYIMSLSLILLIFYGFVYNNYAIGKYLIFIVSTLFVSVTTYAYFTLSYKLLQGGLSSIDILTVRLWPLVISSGCFALKENYFQGLSISVFFKTFLFSILLLGFPVFLSQKSIEKVGPNIHAIFMGFIPLITIFAEILFLKQYSSTTAIIVFILLSIILATITLYKTIYVNLKQNYLD